MVVVSCFPFDDAAQTARVRRRARATAGVPLAIDPNPRSGMLTDRAEFVRGFEALAAGAALVKVGEDDATLLYDEPLDALRERLVDLGVGAVLATQGAAGATLEAGDDRRDAADLDAARAASSTRWAPATPPSPRRSRRSCRERPPTRTRGARCCSRRWMSRPRRAGSRARCCALRRRSQDLDLDSIGT